MSVIIFDLNMRHVQPKRVRGMVAGEGQWRILIWRWVLARRSHAALCILPLDLVHHRTCESSYEKKNHGRHLYRSPFDAQGHYDIWERIPWTAAWTTAPGRSFWISWFPSTVLHNVKRMVIISGWYVSRVEMWWHTVTHGRGSERETGEWIG
jgi:hypothetical protein